MRIRLKVNNSSLTGEAEPQGRAVECSDDNPLETKNLAFCSSQALEGKSKLLQPILIDRSRLILTFHRRLPWYCRGHR